MSKIRGFYTAMTFCTKPLLTVSACASGSNSSVGTGCSKSAFSTYLNVRHMPRVYVALLW